MNIYPAIDLIDGKCVRLTKGDFSQCKEYGSDPVSQAKSFVDAGAKHLHVVDLDGAKQGSVAQLEVIEKITAAVSIPVQVGGGIRQLTDAKNLLEAGVKWMIIGSLAVKQPETLDEMLREFGADAFTLGVDVRLDDSGIPRVATHGWKETAQMTAKELIDRFATIKRVLCTDIDCDGTLIGPNTRLYKSLMAESPHIQLLASGGVGSMQDLYDLKEISVAGVIVGKALYEGKFTLEAALSC